MITRVHTVVRCLIIFTAVSICVTLACKSPAPSTGMRIVSLSPAMTEIIFALGAQERLVGVTAYCTYPLEARDIEKVGDFSNPSIERILGLKPDLVIVNTPEQRRIKLQLEQLGVDVFESSPATLSDIYKEITAIGILLNMQHAAESIVTYMETNIKPRERTKKRVYVELSSRPLITIGSNTFLSQLLELAGGLNIFADSKKAYPVVSPEAVILRDPEIIVVLHPGAFGDRIGWKNISAVRTGRVFTGLDQDNLMRPGPRLVLGFKALCTVIND